MDLLLELLHELLLELLLVLLLLLLLYVFITYIVIETATRRPPHPLGCRHVLLEAESVESSGV